MNRVQQEVDQLYKKHFGKLVASLLYFSPAIDWETAEDLVQDSFSAALTLWRDDTIPDNPAGWVYTVCRNKALNKIRSHFDSLDTLTTEQDTEKRLGLAGADNFQDFVLQESLIDDPSLKLLFSCAHPELAPKVQVIITLKYVANLKVESIARIFGMSIDGVDKLLVRARKKIRDEKILLKEPASIAFQSRLPIVHKIIYLLFNEGYKSSWGKEIIREELCEEALLLNKTLLDSKIGNEETAALHALMLFNASRFKARFGPSGELLDLENQDRSVWNKQLIALGSEFLKQSQGSIISSYHYEASIAWLHCTADKFETTNWKTIADLYKQLLLLNPNPFVELNYAIALYYSKQKQQALDILHQLQKNTFMNQYYLLNSALGKIYLLEGDNIKAREYFEKAIRQTNFEIEKTFIGKMMNR